MNARLRVRASEEKGGPRSATEYIQRQPSFADESPRRELRSRLNRITGVDITDEMLVKRPSIPLEVLADSASFTQFTGTLDWAFKRASEIGRHESD